MRDVLRVVVVVRVRAVPRAFGRALELASHARRRRARQEVIDDDERAGRGATQRRVGDGRRASHRDDSRVDVRARSSAPRGTRRRGARRETRDEPGGIVRVRRERADGRIVLAVGARAGETRAASSNLSR